MAELLSGWDSEYCPDPLPGDELGVIAQVYVGGSSAAHVWTPDERERVKHMPRMPVWVPTPGLDNPRQSALECVRVLKSLGLVPVHDDKTPRKAVMADLETGQEPDPAWQHVFAGVVHARGFGSFTYASGDNLFHYEPRLGYILADPGSSPDLGTDPRLAGKQYAWGVETPGGTIDLDIYAPRVLDHLWI